jgi:hypothetical protein
MGEEVKVDSVDEFCKAFREMVKKLYHRTGTFLGDIKCGRVVEWSVIDPDAQIVDGKVIGYNATASKKKLDELLAAGIITKTERDEAASLLAGSPEAFLAAKKEIKFDVIRWSYTDVVAGFVVLRDGRKMDLEEAIQTPGLCKVDAVGWVGNRYTEFSCIYEVSVRGTVVNPVKEVLQQSLKNDMMYYVSQHNYFKYAKRLFALAKARKDEALGKQLTPLLNGELGRLYQMKGDMDALEWLAENEGKLDKKRITEELNGFKVRLGTIWSLSAFEKEEPKLLSQLKAMTGVARGTLLTDLKRVSGWIEDAYNTAAGVQLKAMSLLPIPSQYRP